MSKEQADWLENPFRWWVDNDRPELGSFYIGMNYKMPLMPVLYESAYHMDMIKTDEARIAEVGVYLMAAALVGQHLGESDKFAAELMAQAINTNADSWLQDLIKEDKDDSDNASE